jgi:hypothetical protein
VRVPKKVVIASREWTVKTSKAHGGGSFNGNTASIEVGTAVKQDVPGIFLHEVAEAILAERLLRYRTNHNPPNNGDYIFVMNHQQFEDFIFDLAYALKDRLK